MKRLFTLVVVLFYAHTLFGQQAKRRMTEADYGKWSRPQLQSVSPDGNWVSYSLSYASGEDTLFAKGPGRTFAFAGGRNGRFAGKRYWLCQAGKSLVVADLATGAVRNVADVSSFDNLGDSVCYLTDNGGSLELICESLTGKIVLRRTGCSQFKLSGAGLLAYAITDGSVVLYDLGKKRETVVAKELNGVVSSLAFSRFGTGLAFTVTENDKRKLYHYDSTTKKLLSLVWDRIAKDQNVSPYSAPFLSEDGERVFFETIETGRTRNADEVMVYNTEDKWIYPRKKESDGFHPLPKLAVWSPAEEYSRLVTDTLFPYGFILKNQRQAVVYNPKDYAPHFRKNEQRDLYLMDLKSGRKELLLERQDADYSPFSLSPSVTKIAYFKDKHWYVRTFGRQAECLDCEMPVSAAVPSIMDGEMTAEGFAGWTSDGRSVLLYDAFDVWKIDLASKKAERLTRGRESQTVFRIRFDAGYRNSSYQLPEQRSIDLENGLVLRAHSVDYEYSGFYKWDRKTGLKPIVWRNARIGQFLSNGNSFAWTEETFERPFEIWMLAGREAKKIGETNPQQANFDWGRETKIRYSSADGKPLSGTLYYPVGFEEGKRYPMIVSIYELQSPEYHKYIAPSLYHGDGFNVTHFVNQGYFVLLPDIVHRIGDPGVSATECVLAAVDAAVLAAPIDEKKNRLDWALFWRL